MQSLMRAATLLVLVIGMSEAARSLQNRQVVNQPGLDAVEILTGQVQELQADMRRLRESFSKHALQSEKLMAQSDKTTRLMVAAKNNDLQQAQWILEPLSLEKHKKDLILMMDDSGKTALDHAVQSGANELSELLLNSLPEDDDKKNLLLSNGVSWLHEASKSGNVKFIETLFSLQYDDAVYKKLLMAKSSFRNGPTVSGLTGLGLAMARIEACDGDCGGREWYLEEAVVVLAKLHEKYNVPLDAQFNGFYQLSWDSLKNKNLELFLQDAEVEFIVNEGEDLQERLHKELMKLSFATDDEGMTGGVQMDPWTLKVTDATGKIFSWRDMDKLFGPNTTPAFPLKVELSARNRAR